MSHPRRRRAALSVGLVGLAVTVVFFHQGRLAALDGEKKPIRPPSDALIAEQTKPANDVPAGEANPPDQAALEEGGALFRGLCGGCHGGSGRGGKGPNLTDDRWLHGETDADIARVIRDGVPRTTMKKLGESLKEQQIANVVAYIRSLARGPGDSNWKPYLSGEPAAGERIFFDPKSKVQCAKCHTVRRKGGRVGPPLDRIANRRAGEYIMNSMVAPSVDIDPRYEAVQLVTDEGQIIVGLRINETNFSIQLREENGRFHSFLKRELEEFRVLKTSLMPENIAQQLTVKELHDLFAFLMTLE